MSPVEAFVTGIKIFDQPWSVDFRRVKGQTAAMHPNLIILAVQRSPWWSALQKVAWFSFDPCHKRFYTGHISDYPLLMNVRFVNYNSFHPDVSTFCLTDISYMTLLHMKLSNAFPLLHMPTDSNTYWSQWASANVDNCESRNAGTRNGTRNGNKIQVRRK